MQTTEANPGINVTNSKGRATPKVSVIIPSYKTAHFIASCLDSVFAQSYRDFEAIVVNDGSPDTPELEKVLAPYMDRIVYLEAGRIVEDGPHRELLAKGGAYAKLWNRQMGGFINAA